MSTVDSWPCNYTLNGYPYTVSHNSTVNDVADPLAWSFFVAVLTLVFTLGHYAFVYTSAKHVIGGLYDKNNQLERFWNKFFQALFSGFWPAGLFLGAFVFYYNNLLDRRTTPVVDPQDTFSMAMATITLAILMSYLVARMARKRHFTNIGEGARKVPLYFGQIFPRAMFLLLVLFPGVYVYRVNLLQFPINTSVFGPSAVAVLVSAILLTLAPLYPWIGQSRGGVDSAYRVGETVPLIEKGAMPIPGGQANPLQENAPIVSTYLLSDARGLNVYQAPQSRRLVGEIEYMPFPTLWLVTYLIYMYVYSTMVYGDLVKPVVYTFITGVVPYVLTVYSHHNGAFVPYHVAMLFFFLCISYLLGAIYTPMCSPDTYERGSSAAAAQLRTAVEWNLMLTGPSYTDVDSSSTTFRVMSWLSFTLSILCFCWLQIRTYNASLAFLEVSKLQRRTPEAAMFT